LKYDWVYWKGYNRVRDARTATEKCIRWYNVERPHSSVGKQAPDEFYQQKLPALNMAACHDFIEAPRVTRRSERPCWM
jgi:putative transposase